MGPICSGRGCCPSEGVWMAVGFGLECKSSDEGCLLTVMLLTLLNPDPIPPLLFPSYSVSSLTPGSSPALPR